LQHGTLPLYGDIALICDALVYPDEAAREAAKAKVRERATTLEAVAGYTISWDEAADAVINGFSETFGIEFIESQLTDYETSCVEMLVMEQYGHSNWLYKR
jgi:lipoyl(octanoyl) transferase